MWRQFAHLDEHGRYDPALPFEECLVLAREVKEYENAYLTQQISFFSTFVSLIRRGGAPSGASGFIASGA